MSNQRNTASDTIRRKRYSFWLDRTKKEERKVEELIAIFKDKRQFTPSIRNGLRLIADLTEGNLDVLFELFPWVKAEFLDYMRELQAESAPAASQPDPKEAETPSESPQTPENSGVTEAQAALEQERQQIADLRAEQAAYEREMQQWAAEKEKQIAAQWEHIERERERLRAEQQESQSSIEKKLEKLEQMLLEQGNQPVDRASTSGGVGLRGNGGGGSGPKQLGAPTLASPNFDDEDDSDLLEVKKSKGSGLQANLNFINSVLALDDL